MVLPCKHTKHTSSNAHTTQTLQYSHTNAVNNTQMRGHTQLYSQRCDHKKTIEHLGGGRVSCFSTAQSSTQTYSTYTHTAHITQKHSTYDTHISHRNTQHMSHTNHTVHIKYKTQTLNTKHILHRCYQGM